MFPPELALDSRSPRRRWTRGAVSALFFVTCLVVAYRRNVALLGLGSPAASPILFLRDPHDVEEASRILAEVRAEHRQAHDAQSVVDIPKRGLSPKPFFVDVMDKYGAPPRLHPQTYDGQAGDGRRTGALTLTTNNTAPVRFFLNFDTLNESLVQADPFVKDRYCWRVGEWFKVGNPTFAKPTGLGPDDCKRQVGLDVDTWCLCLANDPIDVMFRNLIVAATEATVKEIGQFLSVLPVAGNLSLTNDEGSYPAFYEKMGQVGARCGADCVKGLSVIVPNSICSDGVPADVILSVAAPPPQKSVGGTGAFCGSDQNGRPIHLVFNWHHRPDFTKGTFDAYVESSKGLIMHEVFHGLGFGGSLWRNVFDATGQRRTLIEQLPVTDVDGSTDAVYHFIKGTRTYAVAQDYFDCHDDSKWQGLPLMGVPEIGRDSHHETRILREDIMSYGDSDEPIVSAITLATFEDTGLYLANYSKAGCMNWGHLRGCKYVTSRCGGGNGTKFATGASATKNCDRVFPPFSTISLGTAELSKCAVPCEGKSILVQGFDVCPIECFTGTPEDFVALGVPSCVKRPAGVVAIGGQEQWTSRVVALSDIDQARETIIDLAPLIALSFGTCLLTCVLKCTCWKGNNLFCAKVLFNVITGLIMLAGLACLVVGAYGLRYHAAYEAIISKDGIYGIIIVGSLIVVLSFFSQVCVLTDRTWGMVIYFFCGVVWLVICIVVIALAVKYSRDMDGLERNSLALAGHGKGVWSGKDEATALVYSNIESYACHTYQACCSPEALFDLRAKNGAPRQCKSAHLGTIENDAYILSDPSHSEFCELISGQNSKLSASKLVCPLIQNFATTDWTLAQCQADYCRLGLEGYEMFVTLVLSILKANLKTIAGVVGTVFAVNLLHLTNLHHIYSAVRRQRVHPLVAVVEGSAK